MMRYSMLVLALAGCDFVGSSRSTCEAMCDWAVVCHADERDIDISAVRADCLAATNAVDATCEDTELGALGFDALADLDPCLEAVDDRRTSLECDAFTGTEAQIRAGTPPAQCVGAGRDAGAVFEAAGTSTTESAPELCERVADTLCQATVACITDALGGSVPAKLVTAQGDPFVTCTDALDAAFTGSCRVDDRYVSGIQDDNPARDSARGCVQQEPLAASCDALYALDLGPACSDTFSATAAVAVSDALLATAEAYGTL